jgi:hypothetical protein
VKAAYPSRVPDFTVERSSGKPIALETRRCTSTFSVTLPMVMARLTGSLLALKLVCEIANQELQLGECRLRRPAIRFRSLKPYSQRASQESLRLAAPNRHLSSPRLMSRLERPKRWGPNAHSDSPSMVMGRTLTFMANMPSVTSSIIRHVFHKMARHDLADARSNRTVSFRPTLGPVRSLAKGTQS